jgi:hypothetical protein
MSDYAPQVFWLMLSCFGVVSADAHEQDFGKKSGVVCEFIPDFALLSMMEFTCLSVPILFRRSPQIAM